MMSEIGFSPKIEALADCDLHLQYWLDKLLSGIRSIKFSEIPYYSTAELRKAFDGVFDDPQSFDFKGLEMFWDRSRDAPDDRRYWRRSRH